jgi:D-aspartate ligase
MAWVMNNTENAMHAARRLEPWLRKIRGTSALAVILGGSCNGLSLARSLGRRGIPTLLLDSDRLLGTYTRYGKVVLLPPGDSEWIPFLEFVGSRLSLPGVLFATSDLHTLLVSQHREMLQRHFRFLIADAQVLERIVNKRCQYEDALAAGIPIPASHFPESLEQVRDLAAGLAYPCLLKPYRSHSARAKLAQKKVVMVHSSAELTAAYAQITAMNVPLMIQEIIPGPESALFGYLGFWDEQGRERAWVTKQKLRQYPPHFGDASLQVTVDAPQVAELSRRLLRAFNYRGFVGVEFKFDLRDQTYRLMEINPRTVSGNQLAITAGVDFPWIGYQHLSGVELAAAPSFRRQVKYVNEEWDIQAYLALRKSAAINLRSWLGSLWGVRAKAIAAWDDPMPLLAGIRRLVRALGWSVWSIVSKRWQAAPLAPRNLQCDSIS